MNKQEIILKLKEDLKRARDYKDSLKKTTREQYNVFTMLIQYYEEQLRKYNEQQFNF